MEEKKTNNNKLMIIAAVIILIVGAGSFYGGMRYAQSKASANNTIGTGRFQGQRGLGGSGGNRAGGGFVSGSILKTDNQSITLKLIDGGSKIAYLTDATGINKTATGTKADLIVGENVSVIGTANSDGSVIAQTVQIRPAGENRPPQTPGQGQTQGQ